MDAVLFSFLSPDEQTFEQYGRPFGTDETVDFRLVHGSVSGRFLEYAVNYTSPTQYPEEVCIFVETEREVLVKYP